jgi:hypothetical protein
MVGANANLTGVLLGFFLPQFFVEPYQDSIDYTEKELAQYREQIKSMLIATSIASSLIALAVLCFFKDKPPTSPQQEHSALKQYLGSPSDAEEPANNPTKQTINVSHLVEDNQESLSMIAEMKILIKNKDFMLSTISCSMTILFFYAFQTVIGQIITPFGLTETKFSELLGTLYNAFGILGGILSCIIISRRIKTVTDSRSGSPTSVLKTWTGIVTMGTLISLVVFAFALKGGDKMFIAGATALCGFCNLPILFIAYELVVS